MSPPNEHKGLSKLEKPVPFSRTDPSAENGPDDGFRSVTVVSGKSVKVPAAMKSTPLSVTITSTDSGARGPIAVQEMCVGDTNFAATDMSPKRHPSESLAMNSSPEI